MLTLFCLGGEDDDFYTRLRQAEFTLERPSLEIAYYRMMHHKLQALNEDRLALLKKTKRDRPKDGLNSVKYRVLKYKLFTGFTYFLFDVK